MLEARLRGDLSVKRDVASSLPQSVQRALKKFGADIRVARLKRGVAIEAMAECLSVHRTTFSKIENGDPMVGLGLYAAALFVLGLGTPFEDLVDPRRDETGMLLDLERLPKRASGTRAERSAHTPPSAPPACVRACSERNSYRRARRDERPRRQVGTGQQALRTSHCGDVQ